MDEVAAKRARFAAWLQRRMDRRGWSSADLSRKADIPPQSINNWLQGNRTISKTEHIQKLAYALDVPHDEILEVLEIREGGADRMSLAVRKLAPVIDRYEWDDVKLETVERMIRSIGEMYQGTYPAPIVEEE